MTGASRFTLLQAVIVLVVVIAATATSIVGAYTDKTIMSGDALIAIYSAAIGVAGGAAATVQGFRANGGNTTSPDATEVLSSTGRPTS